MSRSSSTQVVDAALADKPSSAAALLRFVGRRFVAIPAKASISLFLLISAWAVSLTANSLFTSPSRSHVGETTLSAFLEGRWWQPLVSLVEYRQIGNLVVGSLLLVVLGAIIEPKIGRRAYLTIGFGSHLIGSAVGIVVAGMLFISGTRWGLTMVANMQLGFAAWLAGTGLAMTAKLGTLWRHRIRLGVLTLLVALVLFAGRLQDISQLAAGLSGLLIGRLAWGKNSPHRSLAGIRHEDRTLIATVMTAITVAIGIAAFSPRDTGPFASAHYLLRGMPFTPAQLRTICANPDLLSICNIGRYAQNTGGLAPTLALLLVLTLLLMFASGLSKGRRASLIGAIIVTTGMTLLALTHYLTLMSQRTKLGSAARYLERLGLGKPALSHLLAVLVPTALVLMLIVFHKFFQVRASEGTYRPLAVWVVVTTSVLTGFRIVAGRLFADRYGDASLLGALSDGFSAVLPPSMVTFAQPILMGDSTLARALREWPAVIFWAGVVILFARSMSRPLWWATDRDRALIREYARDPGGSNSAWTATWGGNQHWFGPRGAVTFRVVGDVAVALGDPLCAPKDLKETVFDFISFSTEHGWTPCFYTVTSATARTTEALDWTKIQIGEETVLDLPTLEFKGKRFQDVRTAINRAEREGIHVETTTFVEADASMREQIVAISNEWIASKGLPEMGFTIGGLKEIEDPRVQLLVGVDESGRVHGVTSWLPIYRDGKLVGRTLDFMRKVDDGFRPVIELLIATAALQGKDEGLERISLSSSPFVRVQNAESDEPNSIEKFIEYVVQVFEPVYGFHSLLAFKSKFGPSYHSVFLAVPDPSLLAVITPAIVRAHFPSVTPATILGVGWSVIRK